MNSELVQTGFFDVEEIRNHPGEVTIVADWGGLSKDEQLQEATAYHEKLEQREQQLEAIKLFIEEQQKNVTYEKGTLYAYMKATRTYQEWLDWLKSINVARSSADQRIQLATEYRDKLSIANGVSSGLSWRQLRSIHRSGEGHEILAKLESGEIKPTQEGINVELEAAKRRNKELQEAKQELQRSFNLFKEDRDKERQELKNKIQAIEHEKATKDDEILSYKQSQAALGDKARLNAKEIAQLQESLRSEARKQLDKDLEKQRQEQKAELKKKEKELKDTYARKEQEYQLKAENTIRSLLSHGIKSMAETQLTIEHTVSAGMLQAVQQLGGKQVDSFLAQAESLQEELDRVIAKLTQGDYIALAERISVNG